MDERERFLATGYRLAPNLFSPGEVAAMLAQFMEMRSRPCEGDEVEIDPGHEDALVRYPRIMQPHRWDAVSRSFMLDSRIDHWLTMLLGESPIAVQTMVYFKPPSARGQALHQDNFYLQAAPGTCAAAWLALDDCDEENGCMCVVPGSQSEPVLCLDEADTSISFTDVQVALPPGLKAVPVCMKAGDVLFFNGQIIHGSGPNVSLHRFRRSLIAHYVEACATQVSRYYFPAYRMDGSEAFLEHAADGGRCGRYVEGQLEMIAEGHLPDRAH